MIITTIASLVGISFVLLSSYLFWKLNHAPQSKRKSTPERYNLDYKTISIPTKNNTHLFAWFIPSSHKKNMPCIIVMHGWGGNASSLLSFAPALHTTGLNLLFIEASNHGQSDKHGQTSMIQFSDDINDGLDWVSHQTEINNNILFIMGHSNAAAGALLTASKRNIDGIISLSAFKHSIPFIKKWIQLNCNIPYWPIGWFVLRCMQFRLRTSYEAIAPINTIKDTAAAILFIQGENDLLASVFDIQEIKNNSVNKKNEMLTVSNAGHDSIPLFKKHAGKKISQFINAVLNKEPS